MTIFFPICGNIYLHKDLENVQYPLSHIKYPNEYLLDYGKGKQGIKIVCQNYKTNISSISFNFETTMPNEWIRLGLSWNLSYKDIWMLMKNYGFENIITNFSLDEYRGGEATFISVANDSSFFIKFSFLMGIGKRVFDTGTLYRIEIE